MHRGQLKLGVSSSRFDTNVLIMLFQKSIRYNVETLLVYYFLVHTWLDLIFL